MYVRELASKVPSPALTSDSLEEKDDSDSLMVEPGKIKKALHSGGPENFKKVQAKKFMKSNLSKNLLREIAFLAALNFFPVQKLIFGHF